MPGQAKRVKQRAAGRGAATANTGIAVPIAPSGYATLLRSTARYFRLATHSRGALAFAPQRTRMGHVKCIPATPKVYFVSWLSTSLGQERRERKEDLVYKIHPVALLCHVSLSPWFDASQKKPPFDAGLTPVRKIREVGHRK